MTSSRYRHASIAVEMTIRPLPVGAITTGTRCTRCTCRQRSVRLPEGPQGCGSGGQPLGPLTREQPPSRFLMAHAQATAPPCRHARARIARSDRLRGRQGIGATHNQDRSGVERARIEASVCRSRGNCRRHPRPVLHLKTRIVFQGAANEGAAPRRARIDTSTGSRSDPTSTPASRMLI